MSFSNLFNHAYETPKIGGIGRYHTVPATDQWWFDGLELIKQLNVSHECQLNFEIGSELLWQISR